MGTAFVRFLGYFCEQNMNKVNSRISVKGKVKRIPMSKIPLLGLQNRLAMVSMMVRNEMGTLPKRRKRHYMKETSII